ncbi:hypothetical protein BG20_I2481 [Candidatus Nitrosarchaeum limnium BG20]|uniref:Uncharacterized protein n=1 Tax=Candidatus Nitrosarchaeum limnium BG20 TaxID=859192 RepID=S2E7F7_9ARCH|nr:hypothetical protein BG20_I2481 [Candidatus Nitrosarchaeum limnium BG20]
MRQNGKCNVIIAKNFGIRLIIHSCVQIIKTDIAQLALE